MAGASCFADAKKMIFFLFFFFFSDAFVAVVAAVALASERLLASPRGRSFVSQDRRLLHVVEEIFVPYRVACTSMNRDPIPVSLYRRLACPATSMVFLGFFPEPTPRATSSVRACLYSIFCFASLARSMLRSRLSRRFVTSFFRFAVGRTLSNLPQPLPFLLPLSFSTTADAVHFPLSLPFPLPQL